MILKNYSDILQTACTFKLFDKNYQYLFTDSQAKCIHRQAQTRILKKYKELTEHL